MMLHLDQAGALPLSVTDSSRKTVRRCRTNTSGRVLFRELERRAMELGTSGQIQTYPCWRAGTTVGR